MPKFPSDAVPITRAPITRACCSTLTPTAPDAPCTTIVSPDVTAVTCSMSAAVTPARSRFAASGKPSAAGLRKTSPAGTVTRLAYPPLIRKAITSSPTPTLETPAPTASTTPATSNPSPLGRSAGSLPGPAAKPLKSAGFIPAARTAILTCPAPGSGACSSTSSSTSGSPKRVATHRLSMIFSLVGGCGVGEILPGGGGRGAATR